MKGISCHLGIPAGRRVGPRGEIRCSRGAKQKRWGSEGTSCCNKPMLPLQVLYAPPTPFSTRSPHPQPLLPRPLPPSPLPTIQCPISRSPESHRTYQRWSLVHRPRKWPQCRCPADEHQGGGSEGRGVGGREDVREHLLRHLERAKRREEGSKRREEGDIGRGGEHEAG